MTEGTPVRSCVGCGAKAPQNELARMTLREGALRLDEGVRAPGRGAYLHRRGGCWKAFVGRRGPVRSLRAPVLRPVREAVVETLATIAGREDQ